MKLTSIDPKLSARVRREVRNICYQPKGICNAHGIRINPTLKQVDVLESALIHAAHHAKNFVEKRLTIPDRTRRVGHPPDNVSSILIEDIMAACKAANLSTGLRYIPGSQSLVVELFIAVEKLLWPVGSSRSPRRLFDRWKKYPIKVRRIKTSKSDGRLQRMLARCEGFSVSSSPDP